MKYRIKITLYNSGRHGYRAQVKIKIFGWVNINHDGSTGFGYEWDKRETALECIDKHYAGNTKRQYIYFHYIPKP